jgi:hypothetical protein
MPFDPGRHGIVVEAETHHCVVEIYVNGLPAGLCGVGAGKTFTRPVHEFLIDGTNELTVLINPGDTPSRATIYSRRRLPAAGAQPPPSPLLDAFMGVEDEPSEAEKRIFAELYEDDEDGGSAGEEVVEGDERSAPFSGFNRLEFGDLRSEAATKFGDEPDERVHVGLPYDSKATFAVSLSLYEVGAMALDGTGHPLAQIGWRATDEENVLSRARIPFPRWIRRTADLGEMFGSLHWQEAPALELDADARADALAFVLQMRDAIESGNADPILELSADRFEEVSRAYGVSADEREDMLRKMLTSQSDRPDWLFITPEEDDLALRLVAGGRMVECVATDWRPLIRGVPGGEQGRFLFPMMIGKRGEDWLIMR